MPAGTGDIIVVSPDYIVIREICLLVQAVAINVRTIIML